MSGIQKPDFFRGEWLVPGERGYDEARLRIFNTRKDPHPPVVARCLGVADVIAAIGRAREHGCELAVRCTGSNFEGRASTDGLTIDLSLMRGIQIDPVAKTARVQGGITGGDLQIEAARHNLAAATGIFSLTGVGVWLGGGVGHLCRRIGYASDQILELEVVTAAGEVVVASPTMNQDLFWAVRGTQGNFGVVTSLTVQLHEIPAQVLIGDLVWSGARGYAEVFRTVRDALGWSSDALNLLTSFHASGASIRVCHSGPTDVAQAEVDRLVEIAAADEANVASTSFLELSFAADDQAVPMRIALDHEIQTREISGKLVAAIEERLAVPLPGNGEEGMWIVEATPCFGALSRAPRNPSAIQQEALEPRWSVYPIAGWWSDGSDDAEYEAWVRDSVAAFRTAVDDSGARVYAFGAQAVGSVEESYHEALPRLRDLKRTWDPDNLFRANLNIKPAEAEGE